MTTHTCREILNGLAPSDSPVTLRGWVRTRRDSKAGLSFVHLSDGSCFHPVQVVAPNTLANYTDEVMRLTENVRCEEHLAALPYLPGLRVPYYLYIGRKKNH